jgi:hypothetical protein
MNAASRVCRFAKPHALNLAAWNSQALLRADPCDAASTTPAEDSESRFLI